MVFGDVLWTVKPGDTLTGIAMTVGICQKGPGNTSADWADCLDAAERIADANGLPDANMIKVGQQLTIPVRVTGNALTPAQIVASSTGSSGVKAALFFGLAAFLAYRAVKG